MQKFNSIKFDEDVKEILTTTYTPKFNTVHVGSNFIKNLLATTYIPMLRSVRGGDYLCAGQKYIYRSDVIDCYSSGYLNDTYLVNSPVAGWERIRGIKFWDFDNKLNTNYISNSEGYDYKTHEKLGKYLRVLRDIYELDLLPLYNCFSNHLLNGYHIFPDRIVNTTSYNDTKVYAVPIRFNTDYTICVDNVGKTTFAPAFLRYEQLLKQDNTKFGSNIDVSNQYINLHQHDNITSFVNLSYKNPVKLRFNNIPEHVEHKVYNALDNGEYQKIDFEGNNSLSTLRNYFNKEVISTEDYNPNIHYYKYGKYNNSGVYDDNSPIGIHTINPHPLETKVVESTIAFTKALTDEAKADLSRVDNIDEVQPIYTSISIENAETEEKLKDQVIYIGKDWDNPIHCDKNTGDIPIDKKAISELENNTIDWEGGTINVNKKEAFAVYDTEYNTLTFFRDDYHKYINGQLEYEYNDSNASLSKIYFTKVEWDDVYIPTWIQAKNKIDTRFSDIDIIINKIIFSDIIKPGNSMAYWFAIPELTKIENLENLNTENVRYIDHLFDGCNNSDIVNNLMTRLQNISILSDISEEAYTIRKAPQFTDDYNREVDIITGGTVAWNQLVQNGNFSTVDNWSTSSVGASISVSNNISKITITDNTKAGRPSLNISSIKPPVGGHVYYTRIDAKQTVSNSVSLRPRILYGNDVYMTASNVTLNEWTRLEKIYTCASTPTQTSGSFYMPETVSNYSNGDTIEFANYNIIDLTQMFGATIADHIYALEQATAGAGVAWFKALFPKSYYQYNAGELMSVSGLQSHDTVGFNQFDKSTAVDGKYINAAGSEVNYATMAHSDYIKVVPNTNYYTNADATGMFYTINLYDSDKHFIKALTYSSPTAFNTENAYYIIVNTAKAKTSLDDLVVNLSWSGYRNGDYEPYKKHSYPLDSTLTLRGVPKLDSSGNLYYDGDEYKPDGAVTRKYGVVDLGTLDWTYMQAQGDVYRFLASLPTIVENTAGGNVPNLVCEKYPTISPNASYLGTVGITNNLRAHQVIVRDPTYTDATAFKQAMSGVMLAYELATETTENATGFINPQVIDKYGTEQYITDSILPVGHTSRYAYYNYKPLSFTKTLSAVSTFANCVNCTELNLTGFDFIDEDISREGITAHYSTDIKDIFSNTELTSESVSVPNSWETKTFINEGNARDYFNYTTPVTDVDQPKFLQSHYYLEGDLYYKMEDSTFYTCNSPSYLGWYELINNEYILTEDNFVDTSKTYYKKIYRENILKKVYNIKEKDVRFYSDIESHLYMLIQVPKSFSKNITILEGDYTDTRSNRTIDSSVLHNYPSYLYDKILPHNLKLMQMSCTEPIPYSPTLLQFLLWNALCHLDVINNNMDRLKLRLDAVIPTIDTPSKNVNYWVPEFRKYLSDYANSDQTPYIEDNIGYLTTKIEKELNKTI